MPIPPELHVFETEHWLVNHRTNSALPGYLMIGSKRFVNDLSELAEEALLELGPLMAKAQRALGRGLNAERVYIGRYGHMPGHSIHFHVIPIYGWVEALFWQDDRYRMLNTFAEGPGEIATDGAELTFFVWREFCERSGPPPIQGPSVRSSSTCGVFSRPDDRRGWDTAIAARDRDRHSTGARLVVEHGSSLPSAGNCITG